MTADDTWFRSSLSNSTYHVRFVTVDSLLRLSSFWNDLRRGGDVNDDVLLQLLVISTSSGALTSINIRINEFCDTNCDSLTSLTREIKIAECHRNFYSTRQRDHRRINELFSPFLKTFSLGRWNSRSVEDTKYSCIVSSNAENHWKK